MSSPSPETSPQPQDVNSLRPYWARKFPATLVVDGKTYTLDDRAILWPALDSEEAATELDHPNLPTYTYYLRGIANDRQILAEFADRGFGFLAGDRLEDPDGSMPFYRLSEIPRHLLDMLGKSIKMFCEGISLDQEEGWGMSGDVDIAGVVKGFAPTREFSPDEIRAAVDALLQETEFSRLANLGGTPQDRAH